LRRESLGKLDQTFRFTLLGMAAARHPSGRRNRVNSSGRLSLSCCEAESFKEVQSLKLDPRNHYHHFRDAVHGEAKNESYFEQIGPMTEAILLGTVAIRNPDTLLEWDAKKLAIPNSAEANKLDWSIRDAQAEGQLHSASIPRVARE